MPASAYERRKYVRVEMNLDVRVNHHIRAAVKKLSLGGCLIESNETPDSTDQIHLAILQATDFFSYGDIVEVRFSLEEEELCLAAEIRWKNSEGIGIGFLAPKPAQANEIATFITRQITKPSDHS